MIDINRYIVNGVVKRDRIVADVKRGKLTKDDIFELDKMKEISDAYFESGTLEKQDKSGWNSRYLDELSLVAVSETFNKEYLLYLNEVATFLSEKRIKKEQSNKVIKRIVIVAIVSILIIFVILFIASKTKSETAQLSVNSIAITENTFCDWIRY